MKLSKVLVDNKIVLLIFFAVGFAFRIYLVNTIPLWSDEIISYKLTLLPVSELINHGNAVYPPGYHMYLKLWFLLGNQIEIVRLSSIVAFSINCYLFYKIGKKAFNQVFAPILTISYMLSGYFVIFDWQARSYSTLTTLILLSIFTLLSKTTLKNLFFFSAVNLLGLFFDYGFVWYLGSLFVFLVYQSFYGSRDKRIYLYSIVASVGIFALLYLPIFLKNVVQGLNNIYWIKNYTSPTFYLPYFLGGAHLFLPALTGLVTLFLGGLFYYVSTMYRKNDSTILFAILLILPLLFATMLSILVSPVLHVRSLQITAISITFFYALGFYWLYNRKSLLFLLMFFIYVYNFFLIFITHFNSYGKLLIKFN